MVVSYRHRAKAQHKKHLSTLGVLKMKKAVRFAVTVTMEIQYIIDDENSALQEQREAREEEDRKYWEGYERENEGAERWFNQYVRDLMEKGVVTQDQIDLVSDYGKDIYGVRPRWVEQKLYGMLRK